MDADALDATLGAWFWKISGKKKALVVDGKTLKGAVHEDGFPVHLLSALLHTSLSVAQAGPEELLALTRGHWEIENRCHHVRDTTFDEDRSQIRRRNGPRVMATLRNFAMGLLRRAGWENIAEATRQYAARSW